VRGDTLFLLMKKIHVDAASGGRQLVHHLIISSSSEVYVNVIQGRAEMCAHSFIELDMA